jgi:hypothetical protein
MGRLVGKGGGPPIGACGKSAADSEGCDKEVADSLLIEPVDELSIDAANLVSDGGGRLPVDISDSDQVSVEELD